MIPFLIQIPFVERVWVWPVVWLHSKKEYIHHILLLLLLYTSVIQVYLPMQDLNYFALEKSLTSVRKRNSMLSRPFAADECFASISYFIFLYSQFTVKKLNVGHKKNTEWKCCDFGKWRGDHLWRYRNKSKKYINIFFLARHAQIASCIRKRVTHLGCALKAIFIEFIHLIRV